MHSKLYRKDDFEVAWHPDKCIHSKICWTNMRAVFDPFRRPWVVLENGEKEAIKKQVMACPSGALQWAETSINTAEEANTAATELPYIEPSANGPLLVKGTFMLVGPDGRREVKTETTALCRCGASNNKPFCDGTHRKTGFQA